ncbi:probable spermidine/putrescine ABC transporter, permease protein [Rhizobium etli CFN 42]|uniref:Probable spermidine/putrescine ABC transporter, permease protein n=1 Tax=Rhizobium etli (strain ATCC 51251 / DSM 11541 / JCM 21823 / NBRC 15573 / CFN 42) TaxID=347834 RepID=Q2K419_RHIEC|nr:probable spermidine/putrescine ABC transporter, permease protein [Rhizobium etli CFN 42]
MSRCRQARLCRISAPASGSPGSPPIFTTWTMRHDGTHHLRRKDIDPSGTQRRLRPAVGCLLATPEALAVPDADTAPALARHHLYRLADRLASAEFLLDRRFFRIGELRIHPCDLRPASEPNEFRHHHPHRHDGRARHQRFCIDRLPDRLLRGALCAGQMEGAVLSWRHAATLVELSRQDLRLEADARQRRHPDLDFRTAPSLLASRGRPEPARRRRKFAFGQLPRHLHRLRLYLAALHDPADAGGPRACARQPDRGLGGSRRHPAPDLPHRAAAPGAPGHRRRFDFHLFADPGRLHHPADHRLFQALHRPGRLCAAGNRRQRAAGGRLLGRADRHHGALSVARQKTGGLRCALTSRHRRCP